MADSGFQLQGSGPEAYERYMVPVHCDALAEDLVERMQIRPGEAVLDVASGTGVVTRSAARRVGTLGRVLGIELNPAMIEVARKAAAFFDQVEFRAGSALELPVEDRQFDAVLCQQAIMFIPDRELAIREMFRALKPGGRVGLNVFRSLEHIPAFVCLVEALAKHASPSAAEFMRAPFVMESLAQMRALFEQAGFSNIEALIRVGEQRYPSVEHFVRYETLNIPDPEIQSEALQQALTREMELLCQGQVDDRGVIFPVQQFVVTAER